MNLRPEQQQCLENLKASISEGKSNILLKADTGEGKTDIYLQYVFTEGLKRFNQIVIITPAYTMVKQILDEIKKFFPDEMKNVTIVLPMGMKHCKTPDCKHGKGSEWKPTDRSSLKGKVIDSNYIRKKAPDKCTRNTLRYICSFANIIITHHSVLRHTLTKIPFANNVLLIADECDAVLKRKYFQLVKYSGGLERHIDIETNNIDNLINGFLMIRDNPEKFISFSKSKSGITNIDQADYDIWRQNSDLLIEILNNLKSNLTKIPSLEARSVNKKLESIENQKASTSREQSLQQGILDVFDDIVFELNALRVDEFIDSLRDMLSTFSDSPMIFRNLPPNLRFISDFIEIGGNLEDIYPQVKLEGLQGEPPYIEYNMFPRHDDMGKRFSCTIYVSATPPMSREKILP